ncbi:MAG: alanine--tRNA ligase [Coriobacteriales bacterium]|nr:alanine--tRNA ligase [Coriobacteriales bacterium]
MRAAELREKYLSFFETKGCKRWPSSSLIPDDPSLLLTSAGMVQFKPYFLGQKHIEPQYVGTTTVQKCVRTTDIDVIGTTARHHSFFEMLGNFSFGKYFKKEMCAWAYEFITQELKLPKEKLYFTVYLDDDETIEIWKSLGVPEDHITRLGADDNFWVAGPTGPCGPCSEIYYDQGPEVGCGKCHEPGCDCDRFLEFWNLVFTQYDRQEDGTLLPLPQKNIDTGMGLERTAAILQGVHSNYDTDIMRDVIAVGEKLSGISYGSDPKADLSLRILADHSRALTFMIADGILPSNEGRGYVLRRLLRRAVRHARLIGIEGPFLANYVDTIVAMMGDIYPEIVENKALIKRIILSEEERFGATLRQGQNYLDDALEGLQEGATLSGITAFTLHDTYGFPVELTREICQERGVHVDMEGFEAAMEDQRTRARNARVDDAWAIKGNVFSDVRDAVGTTSFVGYNHDSITAQVQALVVAGQTVASASAGDIVDIVLDETPFYGEMGGQVGDTGTISTDDGLLVEVEDTRIPESGLFVHKGVVKSGTIKLGMQVEAAIDVQRRERIRRNHTATHILHWALRTVLGDHVKQAGSYVAPDRLRFDFTHYEAVSPELLKQVEDLANQQVMANEEVHAYETSLVAAREAGVTALFGEKYGEFVRVIEAGGFSKELCGGTHVGRTSEIGFIKIISEASVSAGMRRIEALTSYDALAYVNRAESTLKCAADLLKAPAAQVPDRIAAIQQHVKELEADAKKAKQNAIEGDVKALLASAVETAGYPVVVAKVGQVEGNGLRGIWDVVARSLPKPGAAVLAALTPDGRPLLLAAGSKEAVAAGFDAGKVIKAISPAIQGGGGGKAAMAQAGGKDASGIDAALDAARKLLGIA